MDGPYQRFLTSMSRVEPHNIARLQNIKSQGFPVESVPIGGSPLSEVHPQDTGQIQDTQEAVIDGSKGKGRKKSVAVNPGGDVVKHRRTRSGCFTCRSRRVKCDEKRPVCERCQKGNRECVYPEPLSRKGSSSRSSRSRDAPQTEKSSSLSPSGNQDETGGLRLQTIVDQDETDNTQPLPPSNTTASPSGISGASGRHGSETPSQEDNRSSPSSSTAASSGFATVPYDPSDFPSPIDGNLDWSHLPLDYQNHLNWYHENITNFHYGINHDTDDFFKTILPLAALKNEALLNALVGFSAYQSTMQNPDGKIEDFLGYYNKSVMLLLDFLRKKERHDVSTLMTILQLAQIEEYLGDWVNILGHQKAALEIFTKIFSPQTVMQTPFGRMCLSWFARFDGFVAFRGSFPTGLSKDYFDAMREFYQSQMLRYPGDLNWIIADRSAHLRQISCQQCLLYARRNRHQISPLEYSKEHQRLKDALHNYRNSWDPAITDPKCLVTDFGGREPDPDDIVNPYEPGILYDFPIFNTTVAAAEWHSVMIMHMILTPNHTFQEMFTELQEHAYAICRYYETLQYWPHSPNGVMMQQQSVVQTASVFLPKDSKHGMWLRRKAAFCESTGYMRSLSHRQKLAEIFGDPSCVRWWLPNDEGFTPILRSVRDFADERNAVAVTAQQESVREVKHLFQKFGKMDLGESPGEDEAT